MSAIDETHDPARRSWVASANLPGTDFPIQNLPFAVFRSADGRQRVGVGIGDDILDVSAVASHMQGLAAQAAQACGQPALNALMALGPAARRALRAALSQGLDARQEGRLLAPALLPQSEVELCLPARIGGFTDFFASIDHATNAGRLFRPDAPLLPNYRYVPVAYNGRANSVRVEPGIRRPWGQVRVAGEDGPRFTPSQRLDYEVELGAYIGLASAPDAPLAMSRAWDHIFGFSLLNDWSARDIQTWEYQPLGPFLAKSFATSVAPWVVTPEALAPFRCAARPRSPSEPAPLPHLHDAADQAGGGIDIVLELRLRSARMAEQGLPAHTLSRGNTRDLYWTFAQMLAHHTSNGSALDSADLLGSGTVSGAAPGTWGSLLELTRGGAEPVTLPGGEVRGFLADGDEVSIRGRCERAGAVGIGFGNCVGRILPARQETRA